MAYLHLPEQHSTADLVLAGQVAEAFDSEDLYVAWTHDSGPGVRPTVQAVVRDAPPHPLAEAFAVLFAAIAHMFRAMTRPAAPQPEPDAAETTRQAA
jgi:hypothetical protein